MTSLEDQIRSTLHAMAREVEPVPLLERLDRDAVSARRERRLKQVAVAAAVAVVVAAGSLVALVVRPDPGSVVEPVRQPPKVFSVSEVQSLRPGPVEVAVRLGQTAADADATRRTRRAVRSTYVLPVGATSAVQLPATQRVAGAWWEMLSADGTRYAWQNDRYLDPKLEVVDLRNGTLSDVGGFLGYCPELSPDHRTVAAFTDTDVVAVDVATGEASPLRDGDPTFTADLDEPCRGGLGWSPDGRQLAVRVADGTTVVDRSGGVVLRIEGHVPTNGSMSWSPDGSQLLVYHTDGQRFRIVRLDSGEASSLRQPAHAVLPLGWAGSRVVWLAGDYGNQSLVSTDQEGRDPRTWMRFDVGERPVENVYWSVDLRGTARK